VFLVLGLLGRAVAHTGSHRLPTAGSRVRARVKSCNVCGGQSGTGAGFLRVLRFVLPLIHPTNCSTIITIITQGWYSRPINGRSNSGLGSTPAPQINETTRVLVITGVQIAAQILRVPHGPLFEHNNGAHVQVYRHFKLNLLCCVT
jgi:hypothetical protein